MAAGGRDSAAPSGRACAFAAGGRRHEEAGSELRVERERAPFQTQSPSFLATPVVELSYSS
eukprot:246733-Chlamydomonas_euryale.AAC.1